MKYDITVKTLAIIGLVTIVCGLFGCGNQIGDGGNSTEDSNNDNSNVTMGSASENKPECQDIAFLWKPVSESDGNLAVLFEEGVFFQEVWAENIEGGFEPGDSAGFTNGGRLTIRFDRPGENYTGLIVADECEFMVDEPGDRQE